MAKATDSNLTWFGSQFNDRQMKVGIPGGPAANSGGLIYIERVTSAGDAEAGVWLHTDGTNLLYTASATAPSDTNTGTALGASTGASLALDNLVSVQIDDTLAFKTANTHDVGDDPDSIRTLYWTTSLKKIGTTHDVILAATEPAAATYTYTFPDVAANADVMLDTGGAHAITLTSGTASITLAAGDTDLSIGAAGQLTVGTGTVNFAGTAAFDLATGKTMNIDDDLTVSAAVTLDQDLQVTASPTFNALTVTSITDGTASLTTGALSGVTTITTSGAITIDGDSVKLRLGDTPASDSYIMHTAANDLTFYDPNTGIVKLVDMAGGTLSNPDVTGDLTLADGKIIWTDAVDEVAGTWTFANVANDGIDVIANSATTSNVIHVASTSLTSGTGIRVDTAEATLNAGYYFEAYDTSGSSTVFGVGEDGRTVISGLSGDALTLTLGDIQMTDGNIDMDEGKIEVNSTADEISYVKRNNATGTGPVFEIEETNATGGTTLLVDSDATDGNDALQITHAGTGSGLIVTGTAATGTQATFVGPSTQSTSMAILNGTDGGGTGWLGATGVGMLHLSSDGVLAHLNASLIYSTYTGNPGGTNIAGTCGWFYDNSTASGTSYAVKIASTANNALQVQSAATGKKGLYIVGPSGQTESMVHLDGTTAANGWIGGDANGIIEIGCNGDSGHANSSMISIAYSGQAANSALGSCIRSLDSGAASGAQPAYANYFSSTNNDVAAFITGSVGVANITANAFADQTESMVILDGTTADWIGADTNGMIEITSDGTFNHANTSMVHMVKTGATVAAMTGSCLHISDASAGGATAGYVTYINASGDLEALHVDAGTVVVDETIQAGTGAATPAVGGFIAPTCILNVANGAVPTKTELNSATGFNWDAAPVGVQGQFAFLDDNDAQTNVNLVYYDGADYWYIGLTKAVG